MEAVVLDVGHGVAAVVHSDAEAFVIDVPARSPEVKLALDQAGVRVVDAVIISHADGDHIGGVMSLLSDPDLQIGAVYCNPDPHRDTALWYDFRLTVQDAQRRGTAVRFRTELTTSTSEDFATTSDIAVDVLAPSPALALGGVGGKTMSGRRVSANTLSAVVRVRDRSRPSRGILFTGDLDVVGLNELLEDATDIEADVLVFPHHGGSPGGGDASDFADRLCSTVKPETIVFSISRQNRATPQANIVSGVRLAAPSGHIACTQLSQQCAPAVPMVRQDYLSDVAAQGRSHKACCAGSLEFIFTEAGLEAPQLAGHAVFVSEDVTSPLCRRPVSSRAGASATQRVESE
jgi:beta-lactamase superfamily II metal-dependent hydrolase